MGELIFSDEQIAKLLGLKLDGTIRDISAKLLIEEFRQNLDERLEKAKRDEMSEIGKDFADQIVQITIKNNFFGYRLLYENHVFTEAKITEQEKDPFSVGVYVKVYSLGKTHYKNDNHDAINIRSILSRLRPIMVKDLDGITIGLSERVKLNSLEQSQVDDLITRKVVPHYYNIAKRGFNPLPSHIVQANYIVHIPVPTLTKIYNRFVHLTNKPQNP